jgi:nicotinamidase-related amidase
MGILREAYLSPDTLAAKSQEFLHDLDFARPDTKLIPHQSGLLVLDMQSWFLAETSRAFVPSAPAILPGINRIAQAYSQAGLPIVFTRHLNTSADAGRMADWWRALILREDPLSQIDPRLEIPSQAQVVEKTRYDAFWETGLDAFLRESGVSQVVICGVMTHLCCETTARSAFMRGYEVFFPMDGTATYNEQFHRASLLNLSHGFATPVLLDEIWKAVTDG